MNNDNYEDKLSELQELTFTVYNSMANKPVDPDSRFVNSDGKFTNLGFLMSDQCDKMIRILSPNEELIYFSGSLLQQFAGICKAICQSNYKIPPTIIQEAVVNAIIHRDYTSPDNTFIKVYSDRVEIISIGGTANGYTLHDVMHGFPVMRNPKLSRIFTELKLARSTGNGIVRIKAAYRHSDLTPSFEASNHLFKVTLPEPLPQLTNEESSGLKVILAVCRRDGSITRPKVQDIFKVKQAQANRILSKFVDSKRLLVEGKGKSVKYIENKMIIDRIC